MIDVKTTMDMCRAAVAGGLNRSEVSDLATAMLELIEADRAYNIAREKWDHGSLPFLHYKQAVDRRAAALSRFGETK